MAISHGEGRFVANDQVLSELVAGGQIATQYVDGTGAPSMDLDVNPNGSVMAIEGITSPDGRVAQDPQICSSSSSTCSRVASPSENALADPVQSPMRNAWSRSPPLSR